MLSSDFKAVEAVILSRITRLRISHERAFGCDDFSDEQEKRYQKSVKPLKDALKVLKDSFYTNKM